MMGPRNGRRERLRIGVSTSAQALRYGILSATSTKSQALIIMRYAPVVYANVKITDMLSLHNL